MRKIARLNIGNYEEELYTMEELSLKLKCSVPVLNRKCRTGEMKGVKIGKQWQITGRNLEKYLNGE